jgi:hypothetical protein
MSEPDLTSLFRAAIECAATKERAAITPDGTVLGGPVPPGWNFGATDLEAYLPRPRRPHGEVQLLDTPSFIHHVDRLRTADTVVYVDYRPDFHRSGGPRAIAVFNDHEDNCHAAGWRDHRAVLEWSYSPEWAAWTGIDGQLLDQVTFAEFVEDHLREIASPEGGDLLDLAQTLRGSKKDQQIEPPEVLHLSMPIYDGQDNAFVVVRFRYRIDQGKLRLGVSIVNRSKLERDALDEEVQAISDELGVERELESGGPAFPAIHVVNGRP